MTDELERLRARDEYLAQRAADEIEALRNDRDSLQDGVISRDMTIGTLRQRVKWLEERTDRLAIIHRDNLLRECLADLEWIEGTSKTSLVRRALIAEIKSLTMDKGN